MSTAAPIRNLVVVDADNNGYNDIIVTASATSPVAQERSVLYVTNTAAVQRDLSGILTTDLELNDEDDGTAASEIYALIAVDANKDGAQDLVYAFKDGRTKLVLATIAARTDLSSLADPTSGMVAHLSSEMNPSTTPDEKRCREHPTDASCVPSADGAWIRTQSNAGGDVSQWGNGHIVTNTAQQTVSVGSPVSPTDASVADHGPPCALPGSNVVPVQTEFYIEVARPQHAPASPCSELPPVPVPVTCLPLLCNVAPLRTVPGHPMH